jgi:hypothetical protein
LDSDLLKSLGSLEPGFWRACRLVAVPSEAKSEPHYLCITSVAERSKPEPVAKGLLSLWWCLPAKCGCCWVELKAQSLDSADRSIPPASSLLQSDLLLGRIWNLWDL